MVAGERFSWARRLPGRQSVQKPSKRKLIKPARREFAKIALQKVNVLRWPSADAIAVPFLVAVAEPSASPAPVVFRFPTKTQLLINLPDRLLPTKMDTQRASNQDWFQLVSTGESAHIADVPIGSGRL